MTTAWDLCQRILNDDRRHLNAIMLLAEIAQCRQQPEEELEQVTRAVKLYPRNAKLRHRLGSVYRVRAAYAKALAQYEKALKLNPDLFEATVGKAEVYEFKNDYKKARALLERLARTHATSPEVARVYLRILLHDGEHERAVEIGRGVVETPRPPSDALRQTWFQLSKAYEKGGDFEEAFAAAGRGNALAGDPWVPDDYRRIVDSCVETFTPERLASLPRAEPSTLPVFVVGVPRCGSTLTEQIIGSHPDAIGIGESRAMLPIFSEMPLRIGSALPYPQCIAELTAEHVQAMRDAYLDAVRPLAPEAERIVDKALDNAHHLGLISLLFPAARVVHCRRDPIDTCLSAYLNPFGAGQFPASADLEHLGLYYRQHERLMRHWHAVLDIPILEIEYETLVEDQEQTSRGLLEFCGLAWDDACLRFHEMDSRAQTLSYDQVRRPLYRSSVRRSERFGALLDPLRRAIEDSGVEEPE